MSVQQACCMRISNFLRVSAQPTAHNKHYDSRRMMYSYFEIGLKPAVVGCLVNAIAPLSIALEGCSRAQTDQQSSSLHSEKFLVRV